MTSARRPFPLFIGFLLGFCWLASGCSYVAFWRGQETLKSEYERNPSLALSRELAPENTVILHGGLKLEQPWDGPLLVVALAQEQGRGAIVATRVLRPPASRYSCLLSPGRYELLILADLDRNGYFESGEVVGRTPVGQDFEVSAGGQAGTVIADGPPIALDVSRAQKVDAPIRVAAVTKGPLFSSLDDPFFDPSYGSLGLYQPKEFSSHTQGAFFFGLEKLDPAKTLVLFVHGVNGTPRDWKFIVERLDRKRFQPWFYYYPSGLPLKPLGSYVAGVVKRLDEVTQSKVQRMVLVAHSMGGLVSREALNELSRQGVPDYLKLYVSFSTPYGGNDGARMGVEYAPAVVPSWRDAASGSDFLGQLYTVGIPVSVPFHLFFGFGGDNGDGTISLKSQLDLRAQGEARRVYGFNATHVGILNDEDAVKTFFRVLDTAAP